MDPRDMADMAAQLRCPSGTEGPAVARRMNEANRAVNSRCIDLLGLVAGDRVLEIGPGNAAFAVDITGRAQGVSYTGLDWSAEMVAEAERNNAALVAAGKARFRQGSSDQLPFADASYSKVLTVHTLYFWDSPRDHLAEVQRVLKPGGLLCIAFGESDFMRELPFTQFGFTLYEAAGVEALLSQQGFEVLDVQRHIETGRSNTGEIVDKTVNIIICRRGLSGGPELAAASATPSG